MILKYLLFVCLLFSLPYGSTKEFWSRRFHNSIIVRDWIYIAGGDVAYSGATLLGDGKYDRENNTYGLDLSKDWTNATLKMIQTERPSASPPLAHEAMWYDNMHNTIYCFGGRMSFASEALQELQTPPDSIWGFKPDGEGSGTWHQVLGPVSTPFPTDIHRPAEGQSASDGRRAYYLGGRGSAKTSLGMPQSEIYLPGLLMFDFETLTITNSSDDSYTSSQVPGAMINIPIYGENGVLLLLPNDSEKQYVGFNNITFYDKKSKKRYTQVASGDIPEPRSNFCAVGIEGNEKPYFEIFIHGGVINGILGPQAANSDQVYVLSLPSFQWFRASYTSVNPRGGHTCQATNSGQMIIIGGVDPTYSRDFLGDGDALNAPPDPWPQGIGVFDMTALKFKDSYQAKAGAYQTPDIIKNYHSIDGNKYPSSWTSAAVKEIFEGKSNGTSNTTNSTTSISTIQPSSSSSSVSISPSGLPHGTVAGIVVGCTAAIILGVAGVTFMAKHRSRSTKSIAYPNDLASTSPFEPPLGELSAEQRAQEILGSYQYRAELPDTSRRLPMELRASEPTILEMATEKYRSHA